MFNIKSAKISKKPTFKNTKYSKYAECYYVRTNKHNTRVKYIYVTNTGEWLNYNEVPLLTKQINKKSTESPLNNAKANLIKELFKIRIEAKFKSYISLLYYSNFLLSQYGDESCDIVRCLLQYILL